MSEQLGYKEMLRLQGIPSDVSDLASKMKVSQNEIGGAAGNAWPVPVDASILSKIKVAMGW